MGRYCLARGLADAPLAAHLSHLYSRLGLTEGVDDLSFGKLGGLYGDLGLYSVKIRSPILYILVVLFIRRRSKRSLLLALHRSLAQGTRAAPVTRLVVYR